MTTKIINSLSENFTGMNIYGLMQPLFLDGLYALVGNNNEVQLTNIFDDTIGNYCFFRRNGKQTFQQIQGMDGCGMNIYTHIQPVILIAKIQEKCLPNEWQVPTGLKNKYENITDDILRTEKIENNLMSCLCVDNVNIKSVTSHVPEIVYGETNNIDVFKSTMERWRKEILVKIEFDYIKTRNINKPECINLC